MAIETLEDIVDEIADRLGIYGACPKVDPITGSQSEPCVECNCRPGFEGELCARIRAAAEVEAKLRAKP